MKKPLIGINCKLITDDGDSYFKLDRNYVRSVERAGGIPALMPFFRSAAEAKAFLRRMDGLVFTGGPDVDSRQWGEKLHRKAEILHPDREKSDFLALRAALALDTPTLAICLGSQQLNVALGGTLHQHIYDLPGVKNDSHSKGAIHEVTLRESRTREILGRARTPAASWHHQSCRAIGRGLAVTAHSADGIVEGIESPRHRFMIGVQWHPERMQGDARQQGLFRALVAEARLS